VLKLDNTAVANITNSDRHLGQQFRLTYRDGEVLAWGINDYGQLGDGSTSYATSPVKVVGLEDLAIADVSAGGWHSLALTENGGAHYSVKINGGCPCLSVRHMSLKAGCQTVVGSSDSDYSYECNANLAVETQPAEQSGIDLRDLHLYGAYVSELRLQWCRGVRVGPG
jgi:hypothetical protein